MSEKLQRLGAERPAGWATVFGLLLVPLTVAGMFVWGLWSPTDRLDTMTAAVVNLDEPVTIDGQLMPLGRVLAAELIGSPADETSSGGFTWVLTDAADAAAGLDEGRYSTSVTIPEDFSANATSYAQDLTNVQTANIDVAVSERGRLLDSALSNIVINTTTQVLNEQLGSSFVGNVFVGMNDLSVGISNAADGANGLADGVTQLADGAGALATGVGQLAAGMPSLTDGATQLADGARSAATGAGDLATGLDTAAEQIPATTAAQSERLGQAAVGTVEARGTSDGLFTAAGLPLFASLALWAGAFASFLVLAPLWRRSREAAKGVTAISLRSAIPAVLIGAAQGLLVGMILPPLLSYDAGQWLSFLGLSVLAGVSFSVFVQGLSALLGGVGRFVAFVLLVAAFAGGVVSTAPEVLRAVGDASPIGALSTGMQAIAMGASGAGSAAALLVLWGIAGLVFTCGAVARVRSRPISAS